MYHLLIGASLLKTMRPYIRRHVLHNLSSHEYVFLNTFFISIIVFFFFLYKYFFTKRSSEFLENVKKLSLIQVVFFIILSVITVSSTIIFLEFDKDYNTTFTNSIIMKVVSSLAVIFISVFIFKEKYYTHQIIGMFLTVIGIILLTTKKV
jgi:drug/metabolite transporter (DMT)-like permease